MRKMKAKAFTLTEIIAVIVIVGIVLIIAIPASRRLISNNDQDKIENKQRVVEKAMITYAETDNRKMNCVRIKVADLIANGYITNADLASTDYDPALNTEFYYYNGEIKDSVSGVTCGIVESNEPNATINNEVEESVTVPELVETVDVIGDKFVLTVNRSNNTYYDSNLNPLKIEMYTSDNKYKITCLVENSCTLEVPTAYGDGIDDDKDYTSIKYDISEDYYTNKIGQVFSLATASKSPDTNEYYKTDTITPNAIEKGVLKISSDATKSGYIFEGKSSYSEDFDGRILSASASGTVTTCNAYAGEGYCHTSCDTGYATVNFSGTKYLLNNKSFDAGSTSGWNALWKESARSYNCHKKFSVSEQKYDFSDALEKLNVSYKSKGGMSLELNYEIIKK